MNAEKVIGGGAMWLAGLMVVFSGLMKITHNADAVQLFTEFGLIDYMEILGVLEIGFIVLFFIPKTMKLGFIFLSCYFAAAIAMELAHGKSITGPMAPMGLVWISAFLKNPSIFLPSPQDPKG